MPFFVRDTPDNQNCLEQAARGKDGRLSQAVTVAFAPPSQPEKRRQKGGNHAAQAAETQHPPFEDALSGACGFRDQHEAGGSAEHEVRIDGDEIHLGIGGNNEQEPKRGGFAQGGIQPGNAR